MPQPLPGAAARAPLRPPRMSLRGRSARWSWLPTNPGGWAALIAFTLFAAAVVGTAYFAVQESADRGLKELLAGAAIDASATSANVAPAEVAVPARTTGAPEGASADGSAKAPEPADSAPAEGSPALTESPQASAVPEKPAARKTATENRKKLAMRANPPHSSEVSDESKAMMATPEPAQVVASPAAAPAPEPVVPDRWETMNAALAACSGESFLAGVMCTERVRYQYCEGFWGQVPQCRAASRPGTSR